MGRLEEIEKRWEEDDRPTKKDSEHLLSEVHRLRKAIEKHRDAPVFDIFNHYDFRRDTKLYKSLEDL